MKVHFIVSRPTLENDIEVLRDIIALLNKKGHKLARDWIESAYERQVSARPTADDWGEIYRDNLAAIAQSDVVIAETTYENLAVGYQIAVAIHQKKPVLLLRHVTADKYAFVTGIQDEWVQHKEYGTKQDAVAAVEKFIDDNDISAKDMRFNFFIDRQIYNYLRWASFKSGKTKAEIIRSLIEKEIRQDEY